MKKASDKAGRRLVDVLDIHWYSEAMADHRISDSAANTTLDRIARMQAPRSLWDSTYTETSWISQWQTPVMIGTKSVPGPIKLLLHIFASIQKYNPGTKLAITEYNYGAADQITGGLAEVDFLGIIGRDGIFAANFWQLQEKPTYVASAFRLYRNFDGNKSTFGSNSVLARSSDRENTSIYASFNSSGDEIHLVAINKSMTEAVQGTFNVTSPIPITGGKVYGFDQGGPVLSEKSAIVAVVGNSFAYVLPPLSASHLVLKTSGALPMSVIAPFHNSAQGEAMNKNPPQKFLINGRLSVSPKHYSRRQNNVDLFIK
jgi:hypothetical protein